MRVKSFLATLVTVAVPCIVHAQFVSVDVVLNPAGSFKAETHDVKGTAYKTPDGGYKADNITVDIRNLETGVGLRNTHTRKHLGVPKYPQVKLVNAKGKDGKGEATIQVMDKTQKVHGTYKVNGSTLEAEFKMTLSQLGIKDVAYMGIGVEDTVTVHVQVPVKEGAPPAKKSAAAPAKSASTKKAPARHAASVKKTKKKPAKHKK